jgi:hypothetical protein
MNLQPYQEIMDSISSGLGRMGTKLQEVALGVWDKLPVYLQDKISSVPHKYALVGAGSVVFVVMMIAKNSGRKGKAGTNQPSKKTNGNSTD